jgi:hypothetical protein
LEAGDRFSRVGFSEENTELDLASLKLELSGMLNGKDLIKPRSLRRLALTGLITCKQSLLQLSTERED